MTAENKKNYWNPPMNPPNRSYSTPPPDSKPERKFWKTKSNYSPDFISSIRKEFMPSPPKPIRTRSKTTLTNKNSKPPEPITMMTVALMTTPSTPLKKPSMEKPKPKPAIPIAPIPPTPMTHPHLTLMMTKTAPPMKSKLKN
jgi:hypothetical protein